MFSTATRDKHVHLLTRAYVMCLSLGGTLNLFRIQRQGSQSLDKFRTKLECVRLDMLFVWT